MSFLKGNYKLEKEPDPEPGSERSNKDLLELDYYKAAMSKLGGSIAFIMKDKTFLWKGDDAVRNESSSSKVDADSGKKEMPGA